MTLAPPMMLIPRAANDPRDRPTRPSPPAAVHPAPRYPRLSGQEADAPLPFPTKPQACPPSTRPPVTRTVLLIFFSLDGQILVFYAPNRELVREHGREGETEAPSVLAAVEAGTRKEKGRDGGREGQGAVSLNRVWRMSSTEILHSQRKTLR
ncbi:hypothetical protein E2C01_040134 [Portunus trituberculatus]|uniref:Uncharacterized protein n=1 Tax=Portunus trituberculatus TaxID=210409 RepID=A0A5B7FPW6_PORTR|nr:hypothetical protein [Portunus trituberculatus]